MHLSMFTYLKIEIWKQNYMFMMMLYSGMYM